MDGDAMGTLSEAIARLQADGYTGNWFATANKRLQCDDSGAEFDPATVTIDHILRFEGQSDPDDEVILFALSEPGGGRGVYSAPYGSAMPPEDSAVIALMPHRTGDGTTT